MGWISSKLNIHLRTGSETLTDAVQYDWDSAHVLAPLILGIVMIIAFLVWESYYAPYPMFPKRLRQDPRTLAMTLVITFIS